jgi:hypothetical protein
MDNTDDENRNTVMSLMTIITRLYVQQEQLNDSRHVNPSNS